MKNSILNKTDKNLNRIFCAFCIIIFCVSILLTILPPVCNSAEQSFSAPENEKKSASTKTLSMNSTSGLPENISVVLDDNYPPYIFRSPDGNLQGILVDMYALWEKKTGIHVELHAKDWGKAQEEMRAGKYDVIDTMFLTEERAKIYDFSKPYAKIEVPIYFHKNISGIAGVESLKGFTIGVKKGDACIDVLKSSGIEEKSLKEYDSYEQIVIAASKQELVVFVVDKPAAMYFLYKMNIYRDFSSSEPLYFGEFHRAFLKGNNRIHKIVEDGFSKISKKEKSAIENKWYGTPFWNVEKLRYYSTIFGILTILILLLILVNYSLKRKVAEKTSELVKTLDDLKASREHLKAIMENVPGVVYRTQIESPWKALHFGDEIENLLGFPASDFTNGDKNYGDYIFGEDIEKVDNAVSEALKNRKAFIIEYRVKHKDGKIKWVNENGIGVYDENGVPVYLNGVIIDITEKKKSEDERLKFEEQFRHAQKMESLGILAGGIAHDFNNILMMILGNADLALLEIDKYPGAKEYLDSIIAASKRAGDLCKQMLAYSGKGKFSNEVIDLRELVNQMASMFEASVSKKISVKYDFAPNLPAIKGDATQLRQVIINLITNASEAIGDKQGIINLCLSSKIYNKDLIGKAIMHNGISEGEYVYLRVSDNGSGMNEETKAKIFDPFYSTKFAGRGLGLPAVLGIVKGHQGGINVISKEGEGTAIEIFFPAHGNISKTEELKTESKSEFVPHGKILLADDEETLRQIGKKMLEIIGFKVILASDGAEAVEAYKINREDITCVILDLTMPVFDGVEALMQIKRISPNIKVVISSGYNETDISERLVEYNVDGYIQKPYTLTHLTKALKKVYEK